MPMSHNDVAKNDEMLRLLFKQLSRLQEVLGNLIEDDRYSCDHQEIGCIQEIRERTAKFLGFLSKQAATRDMFEEIDDSLVWIDVSSNTYDQLYTQYLEQPSEGISNDLLRLPAQKIFNFHKEGSKTSSLNLLLAMQRPEQCFPRNMMDYITDKMRAVFYCLDKLITWIAGNKQTMRETTTPGASFFGKKHFIEPSSVTAVEEMLDEILGNNPCVLSERLHSISLR